MQYTTLLQNSKDMHPDALRDALLGCLKDYHIGARNVEQTTELINALGYIQCTYKNNRMADTLIYYANTFSNANMGMINYYSNDHILQERHMRLCFELGKLVQQFHTEPQDYLIKRQDFFIKILNKQIPFLNRSGQSESWAYANYIKLLLDIYSTNPNKYCVEISHQDHALASYFLKLKAKENNLQLKYNYLLMADQHIRSAIKAFPECNAHHILFASILEALGTYFIDDNPGLSLQHFEQALAVSLTHKIDINTELYCHFGILNNYRNLIKAKHIPKKQDLLEQLEKKVNNSIERLKKLRDVESTPPEQKARIYNELGCHAFYTSNFANAVFYLEKSIKIKTAHQLLKPNDMSQHQLAATLSAQATEYKAKEQHEKAIELLIKAYKLSKHNGETRKQGVLMAKLAGSYFSMNRKEEAADAAITAMKKLHDAFVRDNPGATFQYKSKPFEANKKAIIHQYKSKNIETAFKQAANICDVIQREGSALKKSAISRR